MKLYTVTHKTGGLTFTHKIVSEEIQSAIEKSCSLLEGYVGDNFKQKALDSKYLTNIAIEKVYIADPDFSA